MLTWYHSDDAVWSPHQAVCVIKWEDNCMDRMTSCQYLLHRHCPWVLPLGEWEIFIAWQPFLGLQWSAVITWSNITWYCTHHCRNWGRISISLNPQKTPHSSPWRASYGMSFENILEKNDCIITALYCIILVHFHPWYPWMKSKGTQSSYGSGHGTATVLLPGFAINW